jgi:hypothetical protein
MMKFFAKEAVIPLRAEARESAEMVSQLLFGELCEVLEQAETNWWQVRCLEDAYEGWLNPIMLEPISEAEEAGLRKRVFVMGGSLILPDESALQLPLGARIPMARSGPMGVFAIGKNRWRPGPDLRWIPPQDPEQLVPLSRCFRNIPYLWGGRSGFGIDCSGFTQLLFRLCGIALERDSTQQARQGTEISFAEAKAGDLAFFRKPTANRISHVGVLDGKGNVLHASGKVREDRFTQEGIRHRDSQALTHMLVSIRRTS